MSKDRARIIQISNLSDNRDKILHLMCKVTIAQSQNQCETHKIASMLIVAAVAIGILEETFKAQ